MAYREIYLLHALYNVSNVMKYNIIRSCDFEIRCFHMNSIYFPTFESDDDDRENDDDQVNGVAPEMKGVQVLQDNDFDDQVRCVNVH